MDPSLESTVRLYQVNVIIFEGRHLAIQHARTKVKISIGKRKKTIHGKTNKTDCPYFNEFRVFLFRLPLNVLLDEVVTLRVYEKSVRNKLVGSCSVDLATVWSQPHHQFYRKWAVLMNPLNPSTGVRGFLKCTIAILAKGIVIKPASDDEGDDSLEKNLLVPQGTIEDRYKARIVFSIFRADCFSKYCNMRYIKPHKPYIKITYGGRAGKTSSAKNSDNPVWNEELAFLDLFPPLTKSIHIELLDSIKGAQRSLGNTNIDIDTLYECGKDAFLPTFGPNFVYLYCPLKNHERHQNGTIQEAPFTYMGRILFALRTEIIDRTSALRRRKKVKIVPKRITPIVEVNYFGSYKKFILFAAIFEALIFDNKLPGNFVNIRVRLGPSESIKKHKIRKPKTKLKPGQLQPDEPEHPIIINSCSTTPYQNSALNGDYSLISFPGKFPCVGVLGQWPDLLRHMYRANVIKKVVEESEHEIDEIKQDIHYNTEKNSTVSEKLKTAMANLSKGCEVILPWIDTVKEDTNLTRHRKRAYQYEIRDIACKARKACNQKALNPEDEIKKISYYLSRLKKYSQDPENTFPDTEVWLLRHNQTLAQQRIKTEDVVFAEDLRTRGIMSGRMQSLLFRGKKGNMKAKMNIFVWFGLAEQFQECLKLLPEGMSGKHTTCQLEEGLKIPSLLICDEKHIFQLRAHIFQGKILYGFDSSGLADPYVRVIILDKFQKTQTRKTTLNPLWDETLVFPTVTLYGPSSFIKQNQGSITVELFDNEKRGWSELIGRCFVKPLVKLKDESYIPPKLKWENVIYGVAKVGEVLIATELLEMSENIKDLFPQKQETLKIPDDIRPKNADYRMEVHFWGVRPVSTKNMLKNKAFVLLESSEHLIKSPILHNVKHTMNFQDPVKFVEFVLPEEPEFAPPLSIKLYHIGSFSHRTKFVGSCLLPSIRYCLLNLMSPKEAEEEKKIHEDITNTGSKAKKAKEKIKRMERFMKKFKSRDFWDTVLFPFVKCFRYCKCKLFKKCQASAYELAPVSDPDDEPKSWWRKFSGSEGDSGDHPEGLKMYREELEAQPEFEKFHDIIRTFDMVTGHGKKGAVVRAKVKMAIVLYRWPVDTEVNIGKDGVLSQIPSNAPMNVLVRVYVICAINLMGKDKNGLSDSYVHVELGSHRINDRKSHVPNNLNPTYGKCYELKGTFPRDYLLRIKIIDHDKHTHDDLIGQTTIDVENRFYSKHYATCGIAQTYERKGVNSWRDIRKPSEILANVCKISELKPPKYKQGSVIIGEKVFDTPIPKNSEDIKEAQALSVLHRWQELPLQGFHLVPEHVETRPLYNPAIPGIEQGKLQLWVDIFPANLGFIPPKIDITPQPPVAMELRAIIWNVVDVVLDERSILLNGRVSDIYLKGWILSLEEETQKTDIHYKSLNGVGNFNWRFIFHFNYIPVERKIVVKKKKDPFDKFPEERKYHCKLEIQVWDNDVFGDDYLGTLILELNSMPRGAKLSNRCTLKMFAPNAGRINLFKIKRTRGWWPFRRFKMKGTVDSEFELTGKVDLELEILTAAEAKLHPAGVGRDEPNALPPPDRPETSFNWFLNPIRTFRYVIWRSIVRGCIIFLLAIVLFFFVAVAIYAFPNYMIKRLLGA